MQILRQSQYLKHAQYGLGVVTESNASRTTIDFDLHDSGEVTVFTTVTTLWKTGVEMEALVGAQIAAATLFDMLKPVSSEMEITNIRVLEKEGGKTSFHEDLPENFKAAVIVTSDGTAAGHRQDTSGQIIKERLETYIGERCEYIILPDEKKLIKEALCKLAEQGCHLVMTTGGTVLGPRDVTVEATKEVIDREIPGIMEAARAFGQERTPYAMLSRGVAGLKGKTIIINLPGSSRGTEESMSALFPAILHSYKMMAGGGHP